jgi:hypothetical protein
MQSIKFTGKETARVLWNLNVHCRVYKVPPVTHLNQVHARTTYFQHPFNIIFPPVPRDAAVCPLEFLTKIMCAFLMTLHMLSIFPIDSKSVA